jgi:hypothetical protein
MDVAGSGGGRFRTKLSDRPLGAARSSRTASRLAETRRTLSVNCLMTEFWDQFFSQTEIRIAFTAALADMNRYAAGEERR